MGALRPGREADNLPGFVVLVSQGNGGQMQPIAARQWSAGFLPSRFQGVQFNSNGDPVLYIANPPRRQRATAARLDRRDQRAERGREPVACTIRRSQTRIAQYEMAFKMQTSVPELMDMSNEPAHVLELYGAKPGDGIVRVELPARAAAGRARRAVHPALSPRLGPSRRREEQHRLARRRKSTSRRRR